MRNLFLAIALFSAVVVAEDAPKTMTKMEVILGSPGVQPGSFASKPKVMYRAGNRYCRIEEAPDPDNGLHGLLIVSEPDAWVVNLVTKTARHVKDPGPTFNCRLPIFADIGDKDSPDMLTRDLQFGLEFEFFSKRGAIPQPGPVLQSKQTTSYRIEIGTTKLALFTYGSPEHPLAVLRQRGEKNDLYWYSGYGQVPFDPKLFEKPEGIVIEEARP